jgi:hypothetical protein
MSETKVKWKRISNCLQADGDGFTISYKEDDENSEFGKIATQLGVKNPFRGDTPQETALIKDGNYYILNGDWRKEYEPLIPQGFEACKALFDENQHARSSWSN